LCALQLLPYLNNTREGYTSLVSLRLLTSESALKVGDKAPDFTLPSLAGGPVSLSSFAGKKNVVISFVPAAWTPVCSEQWPGHNLLRTSFEAKNTVLLGITVDDLPTLFA
jgi:peroxiredoxin